MSLIVLFLHVSKGLLFFRKFFCYFVKFEPKLLLLFIAADVMMLLVFVQYCCSIQFCNTNPHGRINICFSRGPLTTFAKGPQSLGPLLHII